MAHPYGRDEEYWYTQEGREHAAAIEAANLAYARQAISDPEDVQDYYTTPAPSRDGCMVLIVGLGLVAFEGLVRWLA